MLPKKVTGEADVLPGQRRGVGQQFSDRVAKALAALGRLVKTRNILRYLHDEPPRLRIHTQLNRGEARHGLAR